MSILSHDPTTITLPLTTDNLNDSPNESLFSMEQLLRETSFPDTRRSNNTKMNPPHSLRPPEIQKTITNELRKPDGREDYMSPPLDVNDFNKDKDDDKLTDTLYLSDLFNKLYDIQRDTRKHLTSSKERNKRCYDKQIDIQHLSLNNTKILFQNQPQIVHIDKLKKAHVDPG